MTEHRGANRRCGCLKTAYPSVTMTEPLHPTTCATAGAAPAALGVVVGLPLAGRPIQGAS